MSTLDQIREINGFLNSSKRLKNASLSCVDNCEKTILYSPKVRMVVGSRIIVHPPRRVVLGAQSATDHSLMGIDPPTVEMFKQRYVLYEDWSG